MSTFENRLPRVPFDRPVRLTVRGAARTAAKLRAANLSLGGMFIHAVRPYSVGTVVEVAMQTDSADLLPLGEAEVVWRKSDSSATSFEGYGMGLRFVNVRPQVRSLVEALVRHGGTSSGVRARPLDFDQLPTPLSVPCLSPEPPTDPDAHSN